ncbi:RUN and FYVE domain-containing protein 2-like [Dysidea avara]|uniref:RUN and FYVE domain-containing protein 2-like n=1 Tax=Dysidea avara TaxID=196820 RepID=UPI0033166921
MSSNAERDSSSQQHSEENTYKSVERTNLLNMSKLAIKGLIESAMKDGKILDDSHLKLQQLCIVLEYVVDHRLKVKKNLLGGKRGFWGFVETLEKASGDFQETVLAVKAIPGIKTSVGRGRAFLKYSLMQKRVGEYFKLMVEKQNALSEWYQPGALLYSEEGTIIAGLLVGLNTIDYNVVMKGEDFDKPVGVLDFSQYFKDGNYLEKPPPTADGEEKSDDEDQANELSRLLDQKAYLEELNKKLETNVERLQSRLSIKENENTSLSETVSSLEKVLTSITAEKEKYKLIVEGSQLQLKQQLENIKDDRTAQIDTLQSSRDGLNELYAATRKQLNSEMELRQQVEQELMAQKSIRHEKEVALKLIEKDVHEKQDQLISLRKQLDEIKSANVKLQDDIKKSKHSDQEKGVKIQSLEKRISQLSSANKTLEEKLQQANKKAQQMDKTAREIGEKMQALTLAKNNTETDLTIEKQWRTSLQEELQQEKDRNTELVADSKQLSSLKKEHAEIKEKYVTLQETVSEQEQALIDLGVSLSTAKQKIGELEATQAAQKENVWVEDSRVAACQNCKSEFSVAKRRHHCRNCGGIFCYNCSDNKVQLPSSAKPVRVCDMCYHHVLGLSSR